MKRVLVLDGNQRSALATTRALGNRDIAVFVGETGARSLAGASKYCRGRFNLPAAEQDASGYATKISEIVHHHGIDVVMPMTDISTATLSRHASRFSGASLTCPSWASYDAVSNKVNLFRRAEAAGLPCPRTAYIDNPTHVSDKARSLEFPVVVKPAYSRVLVDNRWTSTTVMFAQTRDELLGMVTKYDWLQKQPFMLQQFIGGTGQGLFALYDRGKPITFFCHRRLREKPPQGGVSVLCESAPVDNQMKDIAHHLLSDVNWHGPAMVEFKVAENGTPYLMEINGRFWGSLQLAIDAGVDFPYLAYQIAVGEIPKALESYTLGVRSRWLLGDLDRLYLVLKNGSIPRSKKVREVLAFLAFWQKNTQYEINKLDDLGPSWFELKKYFLDLSG